MRSSLLSLLIEGTTATSRIPPWLASGWGCRDRRLSRSRGNPDRQRGLSRRLPAWHRLFRFADGRVRRRANSPRPHDDLQRLPSQRSFQLPDAAILLGFGRGRASPPKRGRGSLFRFILPAVEQIRSNAVTPARLRDVPALDAFLDDLPLLFGGSLYAWFPAQQGVLARITDQHLRVTWGLRRSCNQAALVPSSKVTCKLPRRPRINWRIVSAFVSRIASITNLPAESRTAEVVA